MQQALGGGTWLELHFLLRRIALLGAWEPARGFCGSANLNQPIPLEFAKKSSHLVTAEPRENLLEVTECSRVGRGSFTPGLSQIRT